MSSKVYTFGDAKYPERPPKIAPGELTFMCRCSSFIKGHKEFSAHKQACLAHLDWVQRNKTKCPTG